MSLFDKLNLRPQERRLVVIIGLVVFFVLNLWLVWPKFGDRTKKQAEKKNLEDTLQRYQAEIQKTSNYTHQLVVLENQGAAVQTEEQASELQKTVYTQAALAGIFPNRYEPGSKSSTGRTNQFFEEQSGTITVLTEEEPLVRFLYNLGSGGSLIRVRSMTLNPDPTRMKLAGTIMLVASYQKKAAPKAVAPPAPPKTNAPPLRPVTTNEAPRPASVFTKTNPAARPTNAPPKK